MAGVPSALNTGCPWQRNGSKGEAAAASGLIFSGLGRASCFQGSPGAGPGEMEQSLPGEHEAGEQGAAGWRDTSTWKELTLPLSKSLQGERTKQARENQGRTKWCWWEKAFQLLGKGEGTAELGWGELLPARAVSALLPLVLSSSLSFPPFPTSSHPSFVLYSL